MYTAEMEIIQNLAGVAEDRISLGDAGFLWRGRKFAEKVEMQRRIRPVFVLDVYADRDEAAVQKLIRQIRLDLNRKKGGTACHLHRSMIKIHIR